MSAYAGAALLGFHLAFHPQNDDDQKENYQAEGPLYRRRLPPILHDVCNVPQCEKQDHAKNEAKQDHQGPRPPRITVFVNRLRTSLLRAPFVRRMLHAAEVTAWGFHFSMNRRFPEMVIIAQSVVYGWLRV
jgi:hypothetical protein